MFKLVKIRRHDPVGALLRLWGGMAQAVGALRCWLLLDVMAGAMGDRFGHRFGTVKSATTSTWTAP